VLRKRGPLFQQSDASLTWRNTQIWPTTKCKVWVPVACQAGTKGWGGGGERVLAWLYLFTTSAIDGEWVAKATPRPLYPRRRAPVAIFKGGSWGRSGGVWRRKDLSLPLDFDPQSVQPIASRYTYYAVVRPTNQPTITGVALCHKRLGSHVLQGNTIPHWAFKLNSAPAAVESWHLNLTVFRLQ
jgi:hypothetical protein